MSVKGQTEGITHGTTGGYKQHIYREIPACKDCLEAVRQDSAKRYKRKVSNPVDRDAFRDNRLRHLEGPSKPDMTARRVAARAAAVFPDDAVAGRDLKMGDVIVFLGRHHRIDRFTAYTGSLLAELGEGTRVAWSGTWGMTVGPNSPVRILPRPDGGAR